MVSESCSEQDIRTLECFAKNIGLAYQIQDDVLDVLTPEEILGKKQNSDADNTATLLLPQFLWRLIQQCVMVASKKDNPEKLAT
jgi:geranylgeranyl pyrophosphate synthase